MQVAAIIRDMNSTPSFSQQSSKSANHRSRGRLLRFLADEVDTSWTPVLLAIGFAGIAETGILALINFAAGEVFNGEQSTLLALAFVAMNAALFWTQWFALGRASDAVEQAISTIKNRVSDKLRRSDLRFVEDQGGIEAYGPLTQIGVISQGTVILISTGQAVSLLFFVFVYLAILSPANLVAILAILAVCIPLFIGGYAGTRALMQQASTTEEGFFRRFGEVLNGFTEIAADRNLSDALMDELESTSAETLQIKAATATRQVRDINFASFMVSLLLFAVVFTVPVVVDESGPRIHELATAVLFLFGSVGELATTVPVLGRFDASVSNLYDLEERLDRAVAVADGLPPVEGLREFKRIELEGVRFRYVDDAKQTTFTVGPIDLTLHGGELLFIVGGNGSGKSTLLKLLTGLYRPDAGQVRLDGHALVDAERPRYRTLFATVFTDFHLFQRLYSLPDLDPAEVERRLAELGLAEKTRYSEQGFSNLKLSTGQKKRIALLSALLKERPIVVLDEMAADQDPTFRRHFYEEMLPALKAQGLTLVCVTHDDHYFHIADRVLTMREGQLVDFLRGDTPRGTV